MALTEGTYIRVQTKTKDDVFGDCVYRVVQTGLPAPERNRRKAGEKDGIKFEMLGGSGPSASPGRVIMDSEYQVLQNVKEGKCEIIPEEQAQELQRHFEASRNAPGVAGGGASAVQAPGGIEMD